MKYAFIKYFKVWWVPIISNIVPAIIFFVGLGLKRDSIIDVSLIAFYINILGTLTSSIVQLFIKRWYFVIPQIGITIFFFYYVAMIFTLSSPDFYGAHLTIPEGVEIHEPIQKPLMEKDFLNTNLVVAAYSQPGMYTYFTNFKPQVPGTFYIKAYEISANDRLSEERMKKQSQVKVGKNPKNIAEGEFTIYEGSWGDPYGARIELWFEPWNSSEEYKVAERNYVVEGWMR